MLRLTAWTNALGFDAVERGQLFVEQNLLAAHDQNRAVDLFRHQHRHGCGFVGAYAWPYPGFSRLAQKVGWVQLLSMNLPRPIVHLSNRSYPLLIKVAAALKLSQITFQVVRDLLEHQRKERNNVAERR